MIALVKTRKGAGNLELRERPEPSAGPGEVVIRVDLAGLCGTDLHILHDAFPYWPPVTLGHEFTGVVESVGPGTARQLVGTRVVCEPHAGACGSCRLCRDGTAELCQSKRSPGWGIDGAFAAKLVLPAHLLHPVPDELPVRAAVLAEPAAVAITAIVRAGLTPGDTVLVIGPGPIGILAALAAETLGAAKVVIAARQAGPRLDFARSVDLCTADSSKQALALVRTVSGGLGADLVIEASGGPGAALLAVEAARRRGRIAAVGLSGGEMVPMPWNLAIGRAVDIVFSSSSSRAAWPGALEVLRRQRDRVVGMGTVFPISEWETAFRAAERRTATKVLIDPT